MSGNNPPENIDEVRTLLSGEMSKKLVAYKRNEKDFDWIEPDFKIR